MISTGNVAIPRSAYCPWYFAKTPCAPGADSIQTTCQLSPSVPSPGRLQRCRAHRFRIRSSVSVHSSTHGFELGPVPLALTRHIGSARRSKSWEIARKPLTRHGPFSHQLEKKPCGIRLARWTLNQRVPGSSPGAPTRHFRYLRDILERMPPWKIAQGNVGGNSRPDLPRPTPGSIRGAWPSRCGDTRSYGGQ
jgi:hypothetical protein